MRLLPSSEELYVIISALGISALLILFVAYAAGDFGWNR